VYNGRAGVALPRQGSHGFGDHAACACPGGTTERGTGGAQDACRQQNRIIKLQAAGMDGKGWHEEGDLPDKIKGLLMGIILRIIKKFISSRRCQAVAK
jgi:hypothetical protein